MNLTVTDVTAVLKQTASEVMDDDVPSMSAAIAYYTVFSLPPLLVVILGITGAIFGVETVQKAMVSQIGHLIGDNGQESIRTMITNASTLGDGIGSKIAGLAALLFGASGAFGQLQKSLNRAWEVEKATEGGGIMAVLAKRLLSFGMVLTIAFLLLVSLALSAVISAVGDAASGALPGGLSGAVLQVINTVVSIGVVGVLFALMFRYLPDAEISWRDVWVGALVTSVLFTLGKTLIGVYLGVASPGSAFGAAGSLALLLVWIYYSSLIVLVGAEFTQVWAKLMGSGIEPDPPGGDDGGTEPAPESPRTSGDGAHAPETPLPDVAHPVGAPRDPAPYSGKEG